VERISHVRPSFSISKKPLQFQREHLAILVYNQDIYRQPFYWSNHADILLPLTYNIKSKLRWPWTTRKAQKLQYRQKNNKRGTSKLLHSDRLVYEIHCLLAYALATYAYYRLHGDKLTTEFQLTLSHNLSRLLMLPVSRNIEFVNAVPCPSWENTVKGVEV
jgi:hypothetical protein